MIKQLVVSFSSSDSFCRKKTNFRKNTIWLKWVVSICLGRDYRTWRRILSGGIGKVSRFISLIFKCMLIASAKSWNARGASHQPVFMGSCMAISPRVCPVYLVEEFVLLVFCVPFWLGWCVRMFLLTFFLHGQYGFSSVGSCCYSREWFWNSRTKLRCMATAK